jgi:NRAMP (natural resistance-associated macrophage protein)-like metal ion transporter
MFKDAKMEGSLAGPSKRRFLSILGPGLITGASDDDPSGIATYSQTGAQFGYTPTWTLLFSYPLMVAIQIISARLGRTTGKGIAGNLRKYYPPWILYGSVSLLVIANTINVGADIGAMADAVRVLIGGPQLAYVLLFGSVCVAMQVFIAYKRYVSVLRWLTLALFAYIATLFFVHVDLRSLSSSFFVPHVSLDTNYLTAIVAIFGTTISPYLFFWQASQEVEDIRAVSERKPLVKAPEQVQDAHFRINVDTFTGMALSNVVGLAIMVTAAATLHASGVTNIQTSAQAAEALKPVAGFLAGTIFALGVIGTGLLAVPVLAGSAAYALGESLRWPIGLDRKPRQARAFYATIAAATGIGVALNFTSVGPIAALYWSAVINGVVAVPIMAIMMFMSSNTRIMGESPIGSWLKLFGWLSTGVMGFTAGAMVLTAAFGTG